jgi:nitroimidazol reductase NimA-like FMN-containing flavoprotein (pyridoxamine 5'-phosphate oxidase superfamily)
VLIHHLTSEECEALLRRSSIGRLGCARNNQPYVVPISFKYDTALDQEKYLYSFANSGQKIEWMRRNPLVCVEVEDVTDHVHWTTVIAVGRFEELTADQRTAAERAYDLLQTRRDWWLPAAAKSAESHRYVPIVYRIRIDSMTGRRAAR